MATNVLQMQWGCKNQFTFLSLILNGPATMVRSR